MLHYTFRIRPGPSAGLRLLHSTCAFHAPKTAAKKLVSEVLKASGSISIKRHEYTQWDDDIGVRPQKQYRQDLDSVLPRAKKILQKRKRENRKNTAKQPGQQLTPRNTAREPGNGEIPAKPQMGNRSAKSSTKAKGGKNEPKQSAPFNSTPSCNPDQRRDPRGGDKPARHKKFPAIKPKTRPTVVVRARGGRGPLVQAEAPDAAQIPRLAHALDRVLFSPGVQFLQDPRTRVYNFSPYLKDIVSLDDFDMDKVTGFVAANKDAVLLAQAVKHGKTYYSSTLSMTLTLHQMYLFFNNYAPGAAHRFDFPPFSRTAVTLPLSVIVEPKGVNDATGEAIYSVTTDKSTDTEIMLGALGHCLEAFLTTDEEEFGRYLKKNEAEPAGMKISAVTSTENAGPGSETDPQSGSDPESAPDSGNQLNSLSSPVNIYNYLACGAFLMRSQLDCFDPRLPGNGTFDLKTRAACAVRYDRNAETAPAYQIWKQHGRFELFDREFADLVRTGALLKYAFQARIGQMDGVFVAYHNVASFFGFQYLPLAELDRVFYTDVNVARRAELRRDLVTGDREAQSGAEFQSDECKPHAEFKPNAESPQPSCFSIADGLPDDNLPSHVAETQFKASLALWLDLMDQVRADLPPAHAQLAFRLVLKRKPAPGDPARLCLYAWAIPMAARDVEMLQDAPQKFATLFRAPAAERAPNLEAAQRHLDEMNAALVARAPVLEYRIRARAIMDGRVVNTRHPYPPHSNTQFEYEYEIERVQELPLEKSLRQVKPSSKSGNVSADVPGNEGSLDGCDKCNNSQPALNSSPAETNPSARRVLAQLRALSRMLTAFLPRGSMDIVDQMRGYSRVGARRSARWKLREAPPVVYTPLRR